MPAPVASGWSESPGGPCTHWKSAALSRRTWKPDIKSRSARKPSAVSNAQIRYLAVAADVTDEPHASALLRRPRAPAVSQERDWRGLQPASRPATTGAEHNPGPAGRR